MKDIQPIIYKIINNVNNKIYVGKDLYNNEKYMGSGKLLKLAFEKYGKDNFKKEIIEFCKDIDHMNNQEIFWIKELNTFTPIGYNINFGGKGGNTYEFRSDDEKKLFKEKIRSKKKGKSLTEETKEKMSFAHKGVPQKRRNDVKCPHCHKIGDKLNFSRWHFDYCKDNPNRIIKEIKKTECEFCHKIFSSSSFNWHVKYCEKNPKGISKKGITMSEDSKRKNREAHKGRITSDETKNKQRIATLGIKRTEETKNKHRKNLTIRWKNNNTVYNCRYCDTQSRSLGNINRWHNDNCKHKPKMK